MDIVLHGGGAGGAPRAGALTTLSFRQELEQQVAAQEERIKEVRPIGGLLPRSRPLRLLAAAAAAAFAERTHTALSLPPFSRRR
jgi:hypothetical protein